jgi:hypothetical protein
MYPYKCETLLNVRKFKPEYLPDAKARAQAELFLRAARDGAIVDGCLIKYTEHEYEGANIVLRLDVKLFSQTPAPGAG